MPDPRAGLPPMRVEPNNGSCDRQGCTKRATKQLLLYRCVVALCAAHYREDS